MSLGIAFEGCAGRSAFSLGAAAQLAEARIRPTVVAGASSGAIIAAALAAGRLAGLEREWLAATGRPVLVPSAMLRGGWPLRMSYILGDVLRNVFRDSRLSDLPCPISIPVTHLSSTGLTRRFLTNDDPITIVDAVLASCFVPGPYSRVIRIHGRVAFDGAWQLRIPFDAARALGAARIILVGGHAVGGVATGFPLVTRIPLPDDCRLLRPAESLEMGSYDTDPACNRSAIAAGRRAAVEFIERHTDWLAQAS